MPSLLSQRFQREISFRFFVYFLFAGVAPLLLFLIVIIFVTMGTKEPLSFSHISLLSPFYRLVLFVILISLTTMLGVYVINRKVAGSFMKPLARLHEGNKKMQAGQLEPSLIPEEDIPPDEMGEVMRVRNEMIRKLIKEEEELVRKEKFATIGQLASFISHDLRTPLATLSNATFVVEKLLEEHNDAKRDKVHEFFSIINRQVTVANQIMNNILGFAKEPRPQPVPISINSILNDAVKETNLPNNIEVRWQLDKLEPAVYVDPIQIKQVLLNLIINAYQSMPEGGILEIFTFKKGSLVDVHVKDTGCGIDPINQSMIFKALFSTKEAGTGLGLAISKQLVENNRGKIVVNSSLGKGTDFVVSLPTSNGY